MFCADLLELLEYFPVEATLFASLDFPSALALRGCCKQLRGAGHRQIDVFSVRFEGEDGAIAAFRAKLQALNKFERIATLALVNFEESFLEEGAAAIAVRRSSVFVGLPFLCGLRSRPIFPILCRQYRLRRVSSRQLLPRSSHVIPHSMLSRLVFSCRPRQLHAV